MLVRKEWLSGEQPRFDRDVPRELDILRDALGHPRSTEHSEEDRGPPRSDRHNNAARLSRDGVNAFSLSPTLNSHRSNNRSVLLPF